MDLMTPELHLRLRPFPLGSQEAFATTRRSS